MKEHQQHSLKSDLIVGLGGLGLAFAAALPECQADTNNDNPRTIYLEGEVLPAECIVDKVNNEVGCAPNISLDCVNWLSYLLPLEPEELNKMVRSRPQECDDVSFKIVWDWNKYE